MPGKSNYFIGNDPAKWRTNVPTYAKVKYQNVYRGIDLVYYGNPQQLEYDFVVAPSADPKAISLDVAAIRSSSDGGRRARGVDQKRRIDGNGDLVIQAGEDEVRLHKPVVYQTAANRGAEGSPRHFVDGHYLLKGDDRVSFEVASYDPRKTLVIDPVLVYSTYLGGSNVDEGSGIAVDSAGNAYVTGLTGSVDFPTASPLQASSGGQQDAFVAKLNPGGSALLYSTYLGGGTFDSGSGIAVDSAGNAYITGVTGSANFPTASPFQAVLRGFEDVFVAKLNPTGSALLYSTYLGGSSDEQTEGGEGIAVDSAGNAYITGVTGSANFPTASPFQAALSGSEDAFVAKLNPTGSALVYSTYLGGSGGEKGSGIAVDSAGNAYVTGLTGSFDFPTAGPFQAVLSGSEDAFVTKLNPTGSALVYSTYLGGSSNEGGNGIAVDFSGNAYVTGQTTSTNFPTANPLQPSAGGEQDAFVAKLNPSGSALVYSTYLGGSGGETGNGIAVDSTGNAYVTGNTTSTNFPTVNPLQGVLGGIANAFVAKIGVGVSPPSCRLTSIVNGPPKQLIVTMQDAASGLQTIQLTAEVNTTVSIPSFTVGATTPVSVTATKVDQSQTSEVAFLVTNTAGKSTSCDPVDFTAQIENRMETHVFRSLSSSEHYVRIVNGKPGLRRIAFRVNGTLLPESHLADGETAVLDIGSAMQAGPNNIAILHASGKAGASAYILIGDSSVQ